MDVNDTTSATEGGRMADPCLATSDLLIITTEISCQTLEDFIPGDFAGKFQTIYYYLIEIGKYATLLTVTAFSVERYLAICHPLKHYKVVEVSRTVRIVVTIWCSSLVLAFPHFLKSRHLFAEDDFVAVTLPYWLHMEIYALVVYFCLVIITAILYVLIGIRLARTSSDKMMNSTHMVNQKRITKILVIVVVTLVTCWTPTHVGYFYFIYLHMYRLEEPVSGRIAYWMYRIFKCLFLLLSSTVHPLLYNVMSNKFREALKVTCCCFNWKKNNISSEEPITLKGETTASQSISEEC
ncbi:GPRGHP2 [Trypoxylus dichotomus]